jgi:cytochrome c-type biogenesis protein CcmH
VLYKPAFKGKTTLLWLAPLVFLLVGFLTVFFFIKNKKTAQAVISDSDTLENAIEKKKKIRSLLDKGETS